jgi:Omptin family
MVTLSKKATLFRTICAIAVVAFLQGQALSHEYEDIVYKEMDDPPQKSQLVPLAPPPGEDMAVATDSLPTTVPPPARTWTIDYRLKSFVNSQTSYEVGTPAFPPQGWAPLSMLRFPLDSSWHGLQVGVEKPDWGVHVEWLTPISRVIHGDLADYDWNPPNTDGSFTDLGFMHETWTDGQMVTLDLEHKLCDRFFGLPFEVWPIGGFRWQRFDLTAYDLNQVKFDNQWTSIHHDGDIITFNQQYYIAYVGGQLRKTLYVAETRPIHLTFQGDWGAAWAYSIDHHLLGNFFGMQADQGSSWHIAFTAEVPLNQCLSCGVEADYMNIRTTGKDWEIGRPTNGPRTNGVCTYSDQTSLTAFLRLNY